MRNVAVAVFLLIASDSEAQQHPFVFSIPPGWTDLSPGAPEANFQNRHTDILTTVRSGKFAFFAMDFREEDGFYDNMNAVVQKGALSTRDDLDDVVSQLSVSYRKELGAEITIHESAKVDIAGVETIRVIFDAAHPQMTMRQVQYLMPGGQDWFCVLTFSTVPEKFDVYRGVFETSANATQGLGEARTGFSLAMFELSLQRIGGFALIGLIVALIVKKSSDKNQPPPRRGMPVRRPPPRPR